VDVPLNRILGLRQVRSLTPRPVEIHLLGCAEVYLAESALHRPSTVACDGHARIVAVATGNCSPQVLAEAKAVLRNIFDTTVFPRLRSTRRTAGSAIRLET
jgi:hypothetical protein